MYVSSQRKWSTLAVLWKIRFKCAVMNGVQILQINSTSKTPSLKLTQFNSAYVESWKVK